MVNFSNLLNAWTLRANDTQYNEAYREAISECIFELNTAICKDMEEEAEALQYLDEQYAESFNIPEIWNS